MTKPAREKTIDMLRVSPSNLGRGFFYSFAADKKKFDCCEVCVCAVEESGDFQ